MHIAARSAPTTASYERRRQPVVSLPPSRIDGVIAGEDKFGCCFCRIVTGDPHKLVKHLTDLACQPFEWFECQPCSKTFPDRRAFTRHQRMHAEERLFKCPLCPAKFSFNRLANHLQGHTDPRPYGCLHCPKVFKDQYSLHRHTHTHALRLLIRKMLTQMAYQYTPLRGGPPAAQAPLGRRSP
ncbi:hypothetical protein HPB47_027338 [Ixodes persulcatus]|uniref:Uncharacterized protein n=1 Tax=Ixodes persulcatus TaxID=34615 RepID=A0AC60PW69_IXOPE|nr:hypothetical protein HPB47_027338 [Ixodes persulcatus]